ncbi:hypothetical protein [Actinomadura rubrisoli]|uniref:Uncharacterized protein n=1 Tax=Actinomadura rubrisoli TaxID=2530368 RepID=A0A4R4ZUP3_9ACTN|nr:hypothetical protein [Actinomadura rubrisoli]TDD61709.1 hypothetical protein E1298_45210 [Actinomadura rubrisoli]
MSLDKPHTRATADTPAPMGERRVFLSVLETTAMGKREKPQPPNPKPSPPPNPDMPPDGGGKREK